MSTVLRRTEHFIGTLQETAAMLTELTRDPEIPGDALIVDMQAAVRQDPTLFSLEPERSSVVTVVLEWPA